jgi:hypothetical protein
VALKSGHERVRGIIVTPTFPDGVPRFSAGSSLPLTVELVRGMQDQEGPFGRPDHPTALGPPVLRDVVDGTRFLVEHLPPLSELRVIEPPADDEGRALLDGVVKEGLPLARSPLPGGKVPH